MNAKIIDIFLVYYGGEMAKGEYLGAASTKERADVLAEGKGAWSGNGEIVPRKAIQVDGQTYVIERVADIQTLTVDLDGKVAKAEAETRQKALAKLTPAERKALGV